MIVQIYEVQDADEADALMDLGVTHIGSVIAVESQWKNSRVKAVVDAVKNRGAKSSLIPLFTHPESLFRAIDYYAPDIFHFCDDIFGMTSGEIRTVQSLQEKIRRRYSWLAIMRTIPIPETGQDMKKKVLDLSRRFEGLSDFFLTDTHVAASPVKGYAGITGRPCDWNIAADLIRQSRIPVILAGGLGPENVYVAIIKTKPAGVDSCTRTNAVDAQERPIRFRKDIRKVRQFIEEVKRAQQELSEAVEDKNTA